MMNSKEKLNTCVSWLRSDHNLSLKLLTIIEVASERELNVFWNMYLFSLLLSIVYGFGIFRLGSRKGSFKVGTLWRRWIQNHVYRCCMSHVYAHLGHGEDCKGSRWNSSFDIVRVCYLIFSNIFKTDEIGRFLSYV